MLKRPVYPLYSFPAHSPVEGRIGPMHVGKSNFGKPFKYQMFFWQQNYPHGLSM